jgi:bacteriocin-like protein
MNHELNISELDAVSGGLRDIHQQDLICQRQAD